MKLNWNVVALGAARAADAVANSFLVVVLPLYLAGGRIGGSLFGLSRLAATGVILSGFGFVNAGVQPFAGWLSDRAGRRKVFVIGGLLALAALNFCYSLTGSYLTVLFVRLGQGVTVAFTITASVALVNEMSRKENRGTNMGTYNSLRLLGFGAGPLVAGFVLADGPYRLIGFDFTGYDAAFYIATLGALLSATLVAVLVREPERRERPRPGRLRIAVRAEREGHLLDPVFALAVGTLAMSICIALLASIETRINRHLDQGPEWFGIEFAAFILSLSGLQPFVGHLSDRFGRYRFIVGGMALLAPTTFAQGLAATPWEMVAARVAQGVAGALVFAPALALAGDLVRKGASGSQLAVLTMAFGIGISIGQLVAGFLIHFGYLVPFATGAAIALVAGVVVWHEVEEPGAGHGSDAGERAGRSPQRT